jgi:hypothetical protein
VHVTLSAETEVILRHRFTDQANAARDKPYEAALLKHPRIPTNCHLRHFEAFAELRVTDIGSVGVEHLKDLGATS